MHFIDRALSAMNPAVMARASSSRGAARLESNAVKDDLARDIADARAVAVTGYSKTEFAKQLERDPRWRKLVRVAARAVVGLGAYFETRRNAEESAAGVSDEARREKDELDQRLEALSPECGFSAAVEDAVVDRSSTGDGYLEGVRNFADSDNEEEARAGLGQVARLYHLPGVHVRILRDGEGFVQRRDWWSSNARVYFKRWGDPRIVNKLTGKVADESLPGEQRASELIHLRNHDPSSDWYGLPDNIASANYSGLGQLATLRAFNLIRNAAGWSHVLSWPALRAEDFDDVEKEVADQNDGLYSAGNVLQLNVPRGTGQRAGQGGGGIITQLGGWMGDIEALLKALEGAREIVRESTGWSGIYLGDTGALNRGGAAISRQITHEFEIEPVARRIETLLNATLVRSWGARFNQLRFRRPKATDTAQESQILARLGLQGALSINDLRSELNRLLPDANLQKLDNALADVPFALLPKAAPGASGDAVKSLMDELRGAIDQATQILQASE